MGTLFEGLNQYKEALSKLSIAKRFDYILVRNEQTRIRAVCKGEHCPFIVYDGLDNQDELFTIKTFRSNHNFSITFKNSRASYKFLAEHFIPKLRIIPDLKLYEMAQFTKQE